MWISRIVTLSAGWLISGTQTRAVSSSMRGRSRWRQRKQSRQAATQSSLRREGAPNLCQRPEVMPQKGQRCSSELLSASPVAPGGSATWSPKFADKTRGRSRRVMDPGAAIRGECDKAARNAMPIGSRRTRA